MYSIGAMTWGTVELESEVRDWLVALPTSQFASAAFYVDPVADREPLLGGAVHPAAGREAAGAAVPWTGDRSG